MKLLPSFLIAAIFYHPTASAAPLRMESRVVGFFPTTQPINVAKADAIFTERLKLKTYVPYNDTKGASESVQWFVDQLKSFIGPVHFDAFQFSVVQRKLAQTILDIELLAQNVLVNNEILLAQLQFASKMFQAMAFAAEDLRVHGDSKLLEDTLICEMVDFHIRVWGLFNSRGSADYHIKDYPEKLSYFWLRVGALEGQFRRLDGVAQSKRRLFWQQRNEVANIIYSLSTQMGS
ncbi:hypothetical protein JCM33374_g3794 [Metschnikowia sp. JCM 33374]|nr:hypothetical protein JCM33374_g3794 [Metschnikowia sp. JCM 33374]